jgi:hypothetical protein
MSAKDQHIFNLAIDYCDKAQHGDQPKNLARGLKLFIQGMQGRQPPPVDSLFANAMSHCDMAINDKLTDDYRFAHIALALQMLIGALK